MTFLLARLDAAITRVATCVANRVFGAIDAALYSWPDEDAVLYPRWKMTGPGHFTIDGADRLADWEAEHEVHEPAPESVINDDGTSRVIPAGQWYFEPTDE